MSLSLLPLGAVPLSRAHTDLALQGFADRHRICKGWSGTSLLPSFNPGEQHRGHMWR
ncbi:hypothetical protein M405DRAFT_803315 [Rhizopogon salebrosus TDB-379]|nr:hypothetical protein M405DRAFT_803315 [Rhizopogon salebrosus TDB-379]